MSTEEALKSILEERSLSPIERNILQVLVLNCDEEHWCIMSMRRLADDTTLSYKTIQLTLKTLIQSGYITTRKDGGNVAYKPSPYNVRRGIDDEAARHRLIVSVEDVTYLKSDMGEKIANITSLIEMAIKRGDRSGEVKLLAQLDTRRSIYGRLEMFLKTHEVKV